MGMLDGLLGNVLSAAVGGGSSSARSNPLGALVNSFGGGNAALGGDLLGAVLSMVQQNGGLTGVVDMFRQNGMGRAADSWVGTGANESLSPDQLQQIFGGDQLGSLASQLGTSRGGVTSMLSQLLPELVNQLTPNGRIPDNHGDLISQGLAMLKRG